MKVSIYWTAGWKSSRFCKNSESKNHESRERKFWQEKNMGIPSTLFKHFFLALLLEHNLYFPDFEFCINFLCLQPVLDWRLNFKGFFAQTRLYVSICYFMSQFRNIKSRIKWFWIEQWIQVPWSKAGVIQGHYFPLKWTSLQNNKFRIGDFRCSWKPRCLLVTWRIRWDVTVFTDFRKNR